MDTRYGRPGNLNGCGEVPVQVLREALDRADMGIAETARALGWERGQLRRALGLKLDRGKARLGVRYDTAVKIALAVGLDPVDIGV